MSSDEGGEEAAATSPPPVERLPEATWEHHKLYQDVKDALFTLPGRFRTETYIAGVNATDIHTLNSLLGATIEDQVVLTLNSMRAVWEDDERYSLYSFIRQPQTFPDVLLRRTSAAQPEGQTPPENILLGIELKGWYLLSKEGMSNYRYAVSKDACAVQDLLVVVSWALSKSSVAPRSSSSRSWSVLASPPRPAITTGLRVCSVSPSPGYSGERG